VKDAKMPDRYRIIITEPVMMQIDGRSLPKSIPDELFRGLKERLAVDPATYIKRARSPWLQLLNLYSCSFDDPNSASIRHLFNFNVRYGDDEESIYLMQGGYQLFNSRPS